MSKRQYNLANKTDYVNRKMFLDPAGPVQRGLAAGGEGRAELERPRRGPGPGRVPVL